MFFYCDTVMMAGLVHRATCRATPVGPRTVCDVCCYIGGDVTLAVALLLLLLMLQLPSCCYAYAGDQNYPGGGPFDPLNFSSKPDEFVDQAVKDQERQAGNGGYVGILCAGSSHAARAGTEFARFSGGPSA